MGITIGAMQTWDSATGWRRNIKHVGTLSLKNGLRVFFTEGNSGMVKNCSMLDFIQWINRTGAALVSAEMNGTL